MLLLLESFHVCPLAKQPRNMCPITEGERMQGDKPIALYAEWEWKHSVDVELWERK